MTPRKVVLDTNVYIGWLNQGQHEHLLLGPGLVRYLSAVVLMELRVGATTLPARRALDKLVRAYQSGGRVVTPDSGTFDEAGLVLQRLRGAGSEIHRASLVHDVLIALSARSIGATVLTMDSDYEAIGQVADFRVELVSHR